MCPPLHTSYKPVMSYSAAMITVSRPSCGLQILDPLCKIMWMRSDHVVCSCALNGAYNIDAWWRRWVRSTVVWDKSVPLLLCSTLISDRLLGSLPSSTERFHGSFLAGKCGVAPFRWAKPDFPLTLSILCTWIYHHLQHCAKSEVDRVVTWPTDHFETM
jgi:hypothetical protein